ncbi:hypothetical protein GCM10009828_006680 [Actinoplanes couchii]|uniref:Uncharacterized protein n=1 Tax=Actinoplanes couchii TaxID=403638 RepID=A0ABQ3XJT4_9ACTN|nr:hypothetical protein Aco03nite_071570 [Actinoplanes couchii]
MPLTGEDPAEPKVEDPDVPLNAEASGEPLKSEEAPNEDPGVPLTEADPPNCGVPGVPLTGADPPNGEAPAEESPNGEVPGEEPDGPNDEEPGVVAPNCAESDEPPAAAELPKGDPLAGEDPNCDEPGALPKGEPVAGEEPDGPNDEEPGVVAPNGDEPGSAGAGALDDRLPPEARAAPGTRCGYPAAEAGGWSAADEAEVDDPAACEPEVGEPAAWEPDADESAEWEPVAGEPGAEDANGEVPNGCWLRIGRSRLG